MAGKKLFGAAEVSVGAARVFVARGEEDLGGGDKEDLFNTCLAGAFHTECDRTYVVLRGRALAGECTAEEGAQEGVQHGRHSIDINDAQEEFCMRGASVPAIGTGRAGRR
jgi:hypothetical protein